MKTNAIIRIIFFSVAIIILCSILVLGLTARNVSAVLHDFRESDEKSVHENSGLADTGIRNLEIEWIAGDITILTASQDQITYTETGSSCAEYPMYVSGARDTLLIRDGRIKETVNWFGSYKDAGMNDLVITIPENAAIYRIEIKAASANVRVNGLNVSEVDFEGASGECSFEECNIQELDIETASGDVKFSGTLDYLEFSAASASFQGILNNQPKSISVDTMSGDIELTLPDTCGFSVEIDAMSSSFYSDYPTAMQGGRHIYGNGACIIDVDAMSGDVYIRKAE